MDPPSSTWGHGAGGDVVVGEVGRNREQTV